MAIDLLPVPVSIFMVGVILCDAVSSMQSQRVLALDVDAS